MFLLQALLFYYTFTQTKKKIRILTERVGGINSMLFVVVIVVVFNRFDTNQ